MNDERPAVVEQSIASTIERFPDGGGKIIHILRRETPKCFYCDKPSTRLCDKAMNPKQTCCDKPMCADHAQRIGKLDFCQDHRLSTPRLKNL